METQEESLHPSITLSVFWLLGAFLSLIALLFQIFLYILLPRSRGFEQKLLTQMTLARLLNVVFEYLMCTVKLPEDYIHFRIPIFAFYMQTDAALMCCMFVFTKNLYDKVVEVYVPKKIGFVLVTITIWIVTFPAGLACPLLLAYDKTGTYFDNYYKYYGYVKFSVLMLNIIFFARILYLATSRTGRSVSVLKTCIMFFNLLCITSLQVLVTDVLSFVTDKTSIAYVLSAINSYQGITITYIFAVLVGGNYEDGLFMAIRKRFLTKYCHNWEKV